MQKVFCIGFPKTGTTSLETALRRLDYRVCNGDYSDNKTNYLTGLYLNGDHEEIDRMICHYDAFADLPWGGTQLYRYLKDRYPDAKFIHTLRETESWYRSLEGMVNQLGSHPDETFDKFHEAGRYGLVYYLRKEFGIETMEGHEAAIRSQYERRTEEVREFFKDRPKDFLELEITGGDGWETLCNFLGTEIPDEPFPRANQATERDPSRHGGRMGSKLKKLLGGSPDPD